MDNQPLVPIPRPARLAWILSLCTAFLWVVLGAIYLFLAARTGGPITIIKWIVALLMFGNAAVLVWIGRGLRKQRSVFYYIALAYLAANILLTITDDFGIPDLIYLLFVGVLFVVLLLSKGKFLPKDTLEH